MKKKNKIAKVVDILECAESSDKLPRHLKTLADFNTAWYLVQMIQSNGQALTFVQNVKDFFFSHGFKVKKEGINWMIAV